MLKMVFFTHSGCKTSKKKNRFALNGIFLYHLLVDYALKRTCLQINRTNEYNNPYIMPAMQGKRYQGTLHLQGPFCHERRVRGNGVSGMRFRIHTGDPRREGDRTLLRVADIHIAQQYQKRIAEQGIPLRTFHNVAQEGQSH